MTYRLTEEDLIDLRKRQDANLANFQRNSGRGLPPKTVDAMERADGVKRDSDGAPVPKRTRRGDKFSNIPTEVDGIKFDSKLEARYYCELVLRKKGGDILYFLRQVPFHLPGGVIYRVDFVIVSYHPQFSGNLEPPMAIEYVDCKGWDTAAGKNKIRQVEAIYGVKIQLVRKVRKQRSS